MRTPDARLDDHFRIGLRPEFVARAMLRGLPVTRLCVGRESRLRANLWPAAIANRRPESISPDIELRPARDELRRATRLWRRQGRTELPGPAEVPGAR